MTKHRSSLKIRMLVLWSTLLVLLTLCGSAMAWTMTLPASLEIIDIEAFYGDTSLDEVVLPDGVQAIRARAFADSSIKKIRLPESLTFIASNAFSGCDNLTAEVYDGSYAQLYCEGRSIPYTLISNVVFGIVKQPTDVTAARGSDAKFTIEADLVDEFAWQRSPNNGGTWTSFSFGETSGNVNTLTINSTDANAAYIYRCRITSEDGATKYSDTFKLIVSSSITARYKTGTGGPIGKAILVTSSSDWTASTDADWFTLTMDDQKAVNSVSGKSGKDVYMTANLQYLPTDIEKREASIVFKNADSTFELKVAQSRTDAPMTGVSLATTSASLAVGKTLTLAPTFAPTYASDRRVTWSSSDTSVATVDANGKVTAVKGGSTTITVKTTDGGFTATCSVKVVTHIVSPTYGSLAQGTSRNITTTISPSLSDYTTTWTSSDTSVLTVDTPTTTVQKPVVTITGKKAGTAVVTGTTKLGGATCTYTVTVVDLTLSASTASIVEGTSQTIKATVNPTTYNGNTIGVTWTSSDTSIATVSNGTIKGIKAGTATITATTAAGSKTATCKVTVVANSISLDKSSATNGAPDGSGTNPSVTANSAWTAKSDSSWLTVSPTSGNSGTTKLTVTYSKNTGTAARTGKITFTCGSKTATYSLTQNAHSISLDRSSATGGTPDGNNTTSPSLTANGAWTAKSDSSWLTVSPASGSSGTTKLTVTYAKNTGTAARTGKITFTCGTASVVYSLTQTAHSVKLSASSQTGVAPDGASYTITVTPNGAWTAKSDSSWLTVGTTSGTATATSVKITAAKNTGTAVRTGKVTFTCGTASAIYTLTQTAHSVKLSASSQTGVAPDGASYTITVTPNGAWTAKSDSSWLTVGTTSGTATATSVKITAAKNTGTAARTGKVTFTCGTASVVYSLTQKPYGAVITKQPANVNSSSYAVIQTSLGKANTSISFSVTATGVKSYQWQSKTGANDWTNISGETSATYKPKMNATFALQITKDTQYRCKLTGNDDAIVYTNAVKVIRQVGNITLNKTSTTLNVGDSVTLAPTLDDTGAANKTVNWSSKDTSIATVTSGGVVKGVKAGTVTITAAAADGSATATCSVTVVVPVTNVTLNKDSTTIVIGKSETLTKTIVPSNATNQKVYWGSSLATVADVDSNGKVTAKSAGKTTISVTTEDGSFQARCIVTVKEATPAINPGLKLLTSSKYAIGATVSYYDHYDVYKTADLTTKLSSGAWTGESDIIYIMGVGTNSAGTNYAYIKYPANSTTPNTNGYVPLSALVAGNLTTSKQATAKVYNLFSRWNGNTSYESGWGVDPGDTVYLLAQSGNWCQIMYSAGSYYRIAWCTQNTYNSIFASTPPVTPSPSGSKVTKYINGIPYWLQSDSRWGNLYINPNNTGNLKTISSVGCTLTSVAMSEAYRTGNEENNYPNVLKTRCTFSGNLIEWGSLPVTYSSLTSDYSLSNLLPISNYSVARQNVIKM